MGEPHAQTAYDVAIVVRTLEGAQMRETQLPDLAALLTTTRALVIGSSEHAEVHLPGTQGISDEHGQLFIGHGRLNYVDSYTPHGTHVQIHGRLAVTASEGMPIELANLNAAQLPAPVSLRFPYVEGIEVCLTFERKA